MKVKLTVMTLLVVGLVMGLSASAFATVTISKGPDSIADVAMELGATGIPATSLVYANDSTAVVTIQQIALATGGTYDEADDFNYSVWLDADKNGIVSWGDTEIFAAAAVPAGAGTMVADVTNFTVPAAGGTAMIIIVLDDNAAEDGETILIGADADASNNIASDAAVFFANSAAVNSEPDPASLSIATVVVNTADADETFTQAEPANFVVAAGDVPNATNEVELVNFELTAGATFGQVISSIALAQGTAYASGSGETADTSIDSLRVYIDKGTPGVLDAADVRVPLVNHTMDAAPEDLVLATGIFAPENGVVTILITGELTGVNPTGEDVALNVDTSAHVVNGAANAAAAGMGADVVGKAMTVAALEYTAYTQDITGPPYGRPNGLVDAIRFNFDVGGTPKNVDDSTITAAIAAGAGTFDIDTMAGEQFTATYNGDVANDSKVYVRVTENNSYTTDPADVPDFVFDGAAARIFSFDGEYGLPDDAGTAVTDLAPPVPRVVRTRDTDYNGKIDMIEIQFSEPLNAASADGFSITGYDISAAALAAGFEGAPFADADETLQLTVDELADYDTGAKPNYAYDTALSTLSDGANQIPSFNQANISVFDFAPPTLVEAVTLDVDEDGMFDTLQLDFSEPIQLNPDNATLTADDVADNTGTDGFNFGAAHTTVYDFTETGNTGLGTAQLLLPVNEVGSFDTAVMPSLVYAVSGTSFLTDFAATPNVLTGVALYTAVDAAPAAAAEVWLQDGISARVTNGAWKDADKNGKLDSIELTFSEPMGTTSSTYTTMTVAGHTVEGATVLGPIVNVLVDEGANYDTGDTPSVTYTGDTIVDANGAALGAIGEDDIIELDGAPPIAYAVETVDDGQSTGSADNNGKIDGIKVSFSEKLNNTFLDNTVAERLADEFTVAGYIVSDAALIASGWWPKYYNSMMIKLTEVGVDTDATPAVTYTAAGDSNLVDLNGLPFEDGVFASTDGAAAAVITATTLDDNADGYLDGIALKFSEDVDVDTTKVRAALTLEELNNVIDLTEAVITTVGNDSLIMVGSSSASAMNWDTGLLPKLSIASDNGIVDGADNVTDEDSDVATTDGAGPVIGRALANVTTKNIMLWFSEPVTNDIGAVLDQGDVAYVNTGTTNVLAIASVNSKLGDVADAHDSTWTAVTDKNINAENAREDMIRVVANAIIDKSAEKNVAPVDTVVISDAVVPTLIAAETRDLNQDGMIDNIMLKFSENIRQDALLGWNDGQNDTLVTISVGLDPRFEDVFTIPGFHIYGYNLTRSDSAAVVATLKLQRDKLLSAKDPQVVNVNDIPDDDTVYLMVVPEEPPLLYGDTGVEPLISFVGGENGAMFADIAMNYVASVTDFQVDDGAPALIWDAWMPDVNEGTILKILFTEQLEDLTDPSAPSASASFKWLVGTEKVDYGNVGGSGISYIVNFRSDDEIDENVRIYTVEVADGNAVPSEAISTIEYRNGGILDDANGNANAASIHGPISVKPPKYEENPFVEGEEETEVPDVFALSQNFPNPFNPTTTINYDIAGDGGHVSLVIYNMTGQKVRTLVDEVKAPGFYSAVWNGTNERGEAVASGIYLYRMISGDFEKFEKMTFVK